MKELPAYYAACDVFVMPSRYIESTGTVEGFGIVYLEAAACGKPVVAGNQAGVPDAVVDGKTGLLVNPWDSDAIGEAIITVLSDPYLASQLGDNGRKRVVELYNWDKVAEQLVNIFGIYSNDSIATHVCGSTSLQERQQK